MPSTLELLARVPMFADLDADDLRDIAETTRLESFSEGENIFEIGEPGRSLFILTEGAVQVRHPGPDSHFELAEFGPGDFFGEMALLNDSPRSATVRALGPVEALVLDKVDFRRLVEGKPHVGFKLLEVLSERIRHADEQIHHLTSRAIRDPLTGLLNKKAFADRLDEEIARSRRYGGSFSLIILDFDDFRSVNETVGRDQGDQILAWVGRVLKEHTRSSDVPFRFEDDSFTILCPWTAGEFGSSVAERLATLINEAKPPIEGEVALSVSRGTATCPADAKEAQALYHSAQRALLGERGRR
jgi:diguanylate cyclase (GGDEF)-like protein